MPGIEFVFANEGYMVQSLKTNCLNGQTEVGIFK
jgi:hypothetical protein